MDLALLYSGGKDSSLAALVLDRFYDVELVTATFGVTDDWKHAASAAEALEFPFDTHQLDRSVASEAIETMRADGYPRNGIQRVHEHALESIATRDVTAIADGSRRDDRVPTISRAFAQSLEDRHGIEYLSPLAGFGRSTVDNLVAETLNVVTGPSEEISKGDYEGELRALLADEHGPAAVSEVFPEHEQTYVRGSAE